jgi:hypothetical protein
MSPSDIETMMAKAVQHIADGYEVVIYGTEGSILYGPKNKEEIRKRAAVNTIIGVNSAAFRAANCADRLERAKQLYWNRQKKEQF